MNHVILNRQKVILSLIHASGRTVSDIELTKWAFLIRQEHSSHGGSAFYDFVPYLYGPYSFSLMQEAGKLASKSLLTSCTPNGWKFQQGSKIQRPEKHAQLGVDWVLRRFGDRTTEELLDYVYSRHPGYTVHSKRQKLAQKHTAEPAVYTAGYEGLSVDAFLNRLIKMGIQHLIDVRHNPIARRFGFHKSTLDRLCQSLGIRYSHVPSLGIQSSERKGLNEQCDYDLLFSSYRKTTLKRELESIKTVSEWMTEHPSVLVCMESDPCTCHRTQLAAVVSKQTGLPIIDLGAVTDEPRN